MPPKKVSLCLESGQEKEMRASLISPTYNEIGIIIEFVMIQEPYAQARDRDTFETRKKYIITNIRTCQ